MIDRAAGESVAILLRWMAPSLIPKEFVDIVFEEER